MIEFGRRPTWNCPKDDDDRKQNTDDEDDTDEDKFDSNFDEKFDQDNSVNPSGPTVDQNLRPAVRSRHLRNWTAFHSIVSATLLPALEKLKAAEKDEILGVLC